MTAPDPLAEVKERRVAREDWWVYEPPVRGYGRPGSGHCRYCGKSQSGAYIETGDLHEDGCPAASEPEADITWLVGEVERLREEREAIIRRSNAVFKVKQAEVEQLHGLLARLEWAGTNPRNPINPHCPTCGGWPAQGHYPGCEWVKVMGRP